MEITSARPELEICSTTLLSRPPKKTIVCVSASVILNVLWGRSRCDGRPRDRRDLEDTEHQARGLPVLGLECHESIRGHRESPLHYGER